MAAIAPPRPSDASLPASTRSNSPAVPIALTSAFAVDTASEPANASSERCTALSAPIDRALRMASVARSGPIVRTVTSEPSLASLSCSAASTARSLISSSTASVASRSSEPSDDFSLRSE